MRDLKITSWISVKKYHYVQVDSVDASRAAVEEQNYDSREKYRSVTCPFSWRIDDGKTESQKQIEQSAQSFQHCCPAEDSSNQRDNH